MPIAERMAGIMSRPSAIRDAFEDGLKLKALYGPENVYDFSIGDPDVPPPPRVKEVLAGLLDDPSVNHAYMPNAGHHYVRENVAAYLSGIMGAHLTAEQIIMTVGAAGGLNCVFKALLDPADEVLVPAPYFVGYNGYVANHGARLVPVRTGPGFQPDVAALTAALTPATKVLLINSPNNPTGAVYTEQTIRALAEMLEQHYRDSGRRVYLVSDEPYRSIIYDGLAAPSVMKAYPHSVVVTSYSKELSLPGERIGFAAVHPEAEDSVRLARAVAVANRVLGFVNAPSLAQHLVGRLQGLTVDIGIYRRRRDMICEGLSRIGYRFTRPKGAFYLFPEAPGGDEARFIGLLKEERILAVPGSGFGCPGYFRLSYAVPDTTIENSLPGFARAFEKA